MTDTHPNTTPDKAEAGLREKLKVLEVIVIMGDDKPYAVKIALPDNQVNAILSLFESTMLEIINKEYLPHPANKSGLARVAEVEQTIKSLQRTHLNEVLNRGEKS